MRVCKQCQTELQERDALISLRRIENFAREKGIPEEKLAEFAEEAGPLCDQCRPKKLQKLFATKPTRARPRAV